MTMWEEDDEDDLDRAGAIVGRLFSSFYGDFGPHLLDLQSGALRPLYRLEVGDESVTVAFDLPGVRKKDIEITCTEEAVSLEAVISRSGKLTGTGGKVSRVERFSREIRMPVRVDPRKASARYKNGMLVIKLPIVRAGRTIKIAD